MDSTEYDFVIVDAVSKNIYVDRKDAFLSDGTKLGTVVTYNDGYRSPYTHLRSSMLGYACINLFSMINRFPDTAVRVAVDSFYINAKHIEFTSGSFATGDERWVHGELKKEMLHDYPESADVEISDDYLRGDNLSEHSNAPPISDRICRYKTVYLNGCGGSG